MNEAVLFFTPAVSLEKNIYIFMFIESISDYSNPHFNKSVFVVMFIINYITI